MSDIEKKVSRDDHETTGASLEQAPGGVVGIYKNTLTQVIMLGFVCFMGPVGHLSVAWRDCGTYFSTGVVQCPERIGWWWTSRPEDIR
jgi:hypothetical protein